MSYKQLKNHLFLFLALTSTAIGYSDNNLRGVNSEGCGNLFFSGEALFFKAQEDGLSYGSLINSSIVSNTSENEIEILNPHTHWDWGLRLGAGYNYDCGWDVKAFWTHFQTKGHDKTTADPAVENLRNAWGTGFGPGGTLLVFAGLNSSEADWKMHLNLVDIELGNHFFFGCLSLRPHIGLRAAMIKQKYHIESIALEDFDSDILFHSKRDRLKSDFEGIGVRTGLESTWEIGCGFSLYGQAAASVVYGHFHNRIFEETLIVIEPPETTTFQFDQKDHYHACRFIADAGLGLRYQRGFCCDTVILTLTCGWEQHLFIDQNRFEDFANGNLGEPTRNNLANTKNPGRGRGDLCIRGWTFGAKLDF